MKCCLSSYGHSINTAVRGIFNHILCHILVRMVTQNLNDDNLNVSNIKTKTEKKEEKWS